MKLAYDAHKAAGGADVEYNGGCFVRVLVGFMLKHIADDAFIFCVGLGFSCEMGVWDKKINDLRVKEIFLHLAQLGLNSSDSYISMLLRHVADTLDSFPGDEAAQVGASSSSSAPIQKRGRGPPGLKSPGKDVKGDESKNMKGKKDDVQKSKKLKQTTLK